MFSSRKLLEPPSKRNNGFLAPPAAQEVTASKRPRLTWTTSNKAVASQHDANDVEKENVLVDTPECTIARLRSLPPHICEEIRREAPSTDQIVSCRVSVPSTALTSFEGAGSKERHVLSYYVLTLRQRLLVWHEGSDSTVTLALPDELGAEERLYPFLFALYGSRISLMAIGRSGIVLFWEDIDLPYESVPLSVQIPLQANEEVTTRSNASLVVSTASEVGQLNISSRESEQKSIICWSNQGNVWEVAMEDRRIRVRSFEREHGGFLSGLTKTVSQFFFTSAPPPVEADLPIQSVKIVSNTADDSGDSVDMLVLFQNGMVERRSFNATDVLDCVCSTVWYFDANRVAISYFSDHFPSFHLAKVFMLSIPYVTASRFGLLVAYVCTAHDDHTPKVKYALFQFKSSAPRNVSPEPEWACLLDYEPVFSEMEDVEDYFEVESHLITTSALYLVWAKGQPVHFAAIQLPAHGQTTVRSRGFSLQGVDKNAVFGFSSRIEISQATASAVKGSVSFLLLDNDQSTGGILCTATASNMVQLEKQHEPAIVERVRRKRVDVSSGLTTASHLLGENLSVEEYAGLLMSHFQDFNLASGPLRVRPGDVANVARAVVGVALQILDARPSSGLRWGNDGSVQSDVFAGASGKELITPKLVRFQLEEKRSRYEEFITFLQKKCGDVWSFIEESPEVMQYMVDSEERLHAAIALCKFQGTIVSTEDSESGLQPKITGQLLLRAIERTVEGRGYQKEQLRLAGYNSFDIFYCEVSKVGEIFSALRAEVQHLSSNAGEGNPAFMHGLLESGYSMQALLKTPTSTALLPSGGWMFSQEIREVIADHLSRLSSVVGYSATWTDQPVQWQPEEVFELTDQSRKLGKSLLDAYGRFVSVTVGESADDLRKEADITKRLALNPLVHIATSYEPPNPIMISEEDGWVERKMHELFADSVKLAETYSYFDAMVYLCYKEDEEHLAELDYVLGKLPKTSATKRLESYCKSLPEFTNFLFRWYGGEVRSPWAFDRDTVRSQMMAYFMTNAGLFGSSLHTYMKGHSGLARNCWMTAVSSEKYDQAAALALHEAKTEVNSLSRRKTMASIAKIASLATPVTSRPTSVHEDVKQELTSTRIQEILLELPLNTGIDHRPLPPHQLSHKALEALGSVPRDDPLRASLFLTAIEALECLPEDVTPHEFVSASTQAWRQCIVVDEELWTQLLVENESSINEQRAEDLMRQTLLFKTMKTYLNRCSTRQSKPTRTAGLQVEMIDALVQEEAENDSVIRSQTRQLFVKALSLAQSP
ncbi:hypothetical protein Poli38472_008534 [Pythium oligandrum]|uniref:Nuclear pore complex protein Nup133 n=1 Tax=Pythium oligandrum TaxID=41045 RepID=A0A8K1C3Q5_PYTOL|nr:hypothetical protein Poli38472_008534 [Pythium oligandrum]|eukprot:TMW55886.1 hypothetical protein Poli38472_008534 [Pythium oligandrum]